MNKKRIQVEVPEWKHRKVKALAAELGMSLSAFVRQAVDRALEENTTRGGAEE
jgi:hypothetical protein